MAPEVKNNESPDSKIKGMLVDKKLTKAERQWIIEMLNSKKEAEKQQIKSETLNDLKSFLTLARWWTDLEEFKKRVLPKIEEKLIALDKTPPTMTINNARDFSGNNFSRKVEVNLGSMSESEERKSENKKTMSEEEISADIQKEVNNKAREDMESMKPKIISEKEYRDNKKKLNKKPIKKTEEIKQEDIVEWALTKEEFKRLSSMDFNKKDISELRKIKKFLIEKREKLTGVSYGWKRELKRAESLIFITKILQKQELQKVSVAGLTFDEKKLPLKPNKNYPLATEWLSSSVRDVTLIRKDVTWIYRIYQGSTIWGWINRVPHWLWTEIWADWEKYIWEYEEWKFDWKWVLISWKEKFEWWFYGWSPAWEMKVTLANWDKIIWIMESYNLDLGIIKWIKINKKWELIGLWDDHKYREATQQDKKEYKKQKQI